MQPSRFALLFIFLTMLIDTIGLGLIIPVSPGIIAELTHQDLSGAARWGGWLFFVYAAMQFLCAPLIGNLSDRFGRRPVLILSLLMLGLDYTITGFAPTIAWLFIGRTLSGMAGGAYTTVNAYIADISPPEKRAANFGLTGAAFGLGFILGPVMGGLFGQYFGLRVPFFIAAGLALANALFGLTVLKESLPRARRRKFELWRANPLGTLKALNRYPALIPLFAVLVMVRLAHDALPSTWTYYTMLKFHWGPAAVSLSLAMVGVLMALSFGVLPRLLVPRLGETRAVFLGLGCAALAYLGYAFAPTPLVLYGWMIMFALGGVAGPALNAILSHLVPGDEQGELQGAIASIGALTSVVSPVVMTSLFAWFTSAAAPVYFPGASFAAACAAELVALAVFVSAHARKESRDIT